MTAAPLPRTATILPCPHEEAKIALLGHHHSIPLPTCLTCAQPSEQAEAQRREPPARSHTARGTDLLGPEPTLSSCFFLSVLALVLLTRGLSGSPKPSVTGPPQ